MHVAQDKESVAGSTEFGSERSGCLNRREFPA